VTLEELTDRQTGRIRVRLVDIATESYQVAREYMIRLEPEDMSEPQLTRLSAKTSLTPQAFATRFGRLFSNLPAKS
jgi:6-phosphofructokinase 1